ncbi:BAG family molecular chaperone regulator 3-like [Andrographis paniculata]|uniref:BAG family molecular chaperone regulator 3-like n=1 Tax=Andrographis paniculata TaxID=175694 RepID=UPI0021E96555|nr:BAG family molecular chaperone regulator 3-like [Andrographis paniculata]XP_051143383.1 BAG family molecular chaperone regulator 3-like [Andrographis paniculata]
MMRMRTGRNNGGVVVGGENEWELRPGGMLVQNRHQSHAPPPPPTIRLRVKYGSTYHEVNISSRATFGELKKMLSGRTGLHHEDQKVYYKDKERESMAYLDIAGVKNNSKIVLQEDPICKEKRYLQMKKNAKMEKAAKCISRISLEVDIIAAQVSALESTFSKGGQVSEKDVVNLIELLMNQLLKLDEIVVDGDVKLQRKMQVKRAQSYVETLEMLKVRNSGKRHVLTPENGKNLVEHEPYEQRQEIRSYYLPEQCQQASAPGRGPVVITMQWEMFDTMPAPALSPAAVTTPWRPTHT